MKLEIKRSEPLWKNKCFFHPATSQWSDKRLMMTMQAIRGSDSFGPVNWSFSQDGGLTWSSPENIPAFASRKLKNGLHEGNADVRPFMHTPTRKIIAIGCNTYYTADGKYTPWKPQFPVYSVLSPDGSWSKRNTLESESSRQYDNYRVACTQIIVLSNGDILIPVYLQEDSTTDRYSVSCVLCSFNGSALKVKSTGNILRFEFGRGLMEPSLINFDGKFHMTIRAEDGHAYRSISENGINWDEIQPWKWDDGKKLETSSTQQHWLKNGKSLYLVYTRKSRCNEKVPRYRAPLYISRFDHLKGHLIRESEQIVFPLVFYGKNPNLLGNFHVCGLANGENIVTVGAWWQSNPYHTEVWQADVKTIFSR